MSTFTLFNLNGKPHSVSMVNDGCDIHTGDEFIAIEGDFSNYYLDHDFNLNEKSELIITNTTPLDLGIRHSDDFIVVNNELYQFEEGEHAIINFTEPGEYEIHTSLLEYLDKTYTVII